MNDLKLAPSILSADFARLGEQVAEVTRYGADYIHVDVMDGSFVPPITIGDEAVRAIRRHTQIPLDVHLMINNPENQIESFARAGADIITVHVEACIHLHRVISQIKQSGKKAGVSLNPATPLEAISEILPLVDLVLVMSVNPGYSGQSFIPQTLDKVSRLRKILDERKLTAELEVDGGIKADNAAAIARAGARVMVAGSAIFNHKESVQDALTKMRKAIEDAI